MSGGPAPKAAAGIKRSHDKDGPPKHDDLTQDINSTTTSAFSNDNKSGNTNKRSRSTAQIDDVTPSPVSSSPLPSSSSINDDTKRSHDNDDDDGHTVIMLPQFNDELAAAEAASASKQNRGGRLGVVRGRGRRGTIASSTGNRRGGGRGRGDVTTTLMSTTSSNNNETNNSDWPPSKRMARVMAQHRERQRAMMGELSRHSNL
jgi:hypothetical protein